MIQNDLYMYLTTKSSDSEFKLIIIGVKIALIRLSGLSKNLSGEVDRPTEVIRRI